MLKAVTKSLEADKALHKMAKAARIFPMTPVRDTKMDKADKATMGKIQYPKTLTTTQRLTGPVAIKLSKP